MCNQPAPDPRDATIADLRQQLAHSQSQREDYKEVWKTTRNECDEPRQALAVARSLLTEYVQIDGVVEECAPPCEVHQALSILDAALAATQERK